MTLRRGDFQTFVNRHLAPGVVGGFASMNPRAVVLAGPGAFKADSALPVLVGGFAWATPSDGVAYGQLKASSFLGFVANEEQTVITDFLGVSRLAVQAGFPVTLYSHGDFWADLGGTAAVAAGATIYANPESGAATTSATHFAATGVVASNVLTVSAVTAGALVVGDVVTGTGISTTIVAQLTGTPGGAGTYTVVNADASSTAITAASIDTGYKAASVLSAQASTTSASLDADGVLTVSATLTGTIELGDGNDVVVNGANIPANTFLVSQITGTSGSTGTYQTTSLGVVGTAAAVTFTSGRLVKISRTY